MDLTIDQALQQGVAAHKEGKLQEAERLYRAILQTQPTHPDANHNLGVLAVSVNKTQAALPLLKTALDANPNQRQFWLSYIDALIKGKQFENAKEILAQGKKSGLSEEKVAALSQQLTLITQAEESTLPEQKKSLTFAEKRKKLSEKKKSEFVILSLLKMLKYNKVSLKNSNIPKDQNYEILKFITKTFNNSNSKNIIISNRSNNPIMLNKRDLEIIINKILT